MTHTLELKADELRHSLERLDEAIKSRAPEIYRALRPGLDKRQIRDAFRVLSFDVPDIVGAFYAWHDGADLVSGPDRAELFPNAQMLPLVEMMRTRTEVFEAHKDTGENPWDLRWLPMFSHRGSRRSMTSWRRTLTVSTWVMLAMRIRSMRRPADTACVRTRAATRDLK